jgi:hypothetical protein
MGVCLAPGGEGTNTSRLLLGAIALHPIPHPPQRVVSHARARDWLTGSGDVLEFTTFCGLTDEAVDRCLEESALRDKDRLSGEEIRITRL